MITGRDIGERFIRAVEVSRMAFTSEGPRAPTKAAWIDYQYTQADKNGWGSERLEQERRAFTAIKAPTANEVSEAEETQLWLLHVTDESERRCLTAWAWCSATRRFFKDWCKAEDIHPETGRRRKERAILRILLAVQGKPLQHNENAVSRLLPDTPVLGDNSVIIAEDAPGFWRDQDAKPMACDFDTDLHGFDWAEKQNERRREREKRKAAA